VKIASPPHAVLGLGMFAVGLGVLLFVFSVQNRTQDQNRTRIGLICALAVGVLIALWADFATEYTWPNLQHGAHFYLVVTVPFPLLLALATRAARVRAPATIAAALYTLIYIFMILALPLFPAHPKLAPIYHPLDNMLPPAFPLLLIFPAAAIDLIGWFFARRQLTFSSDAGDQTNRLAPHPPPSLGSCGAASGLLPVEGRGGSDSVSSKATRRKWLRPGWWKDWLLAAGFAAVFLAVVFAVQWPFSGFLLSDAADNRFFARSGHWPYFVKPGDWMNSFWDLEQDPLTLKGLAGAFCRAFLSARAGLWLGNYLLRLKR
jgi:hypothetical protein